MPRNRHKKGKNASYSQNKTLASAYPASEAPPQDKGKGKGKAKKSTSIASTEEDKVNATPLLAASGGNSSQAEGRLGIASDTSKSKEVMQLHDAEEESGSLSRSDSQAPLNITPPPSKVIESFHEYLNDLLAKAEIKRQYIPITPWEKFKSGAYTHIGKYLTTYTGDFLELIAVSGLNLLGYVSRYKDSIAPWFTIVSDTANLFSVFGDWLKVKGRQYEAEKIYKSFLSYYDRLIKVKSKNADNKLIGLQGKHYYEKVINDCHGEFTKEEVFKLASSAVLGILVLIEGWLIYRIQSEEDKQGNDNSLFLTCNVIGLAIKVLNSTVNYKEFFIKSQAEKIAEMQIKGEMLKLLENLEARQGEVYLAAEEAELERQEAKDAVAAKIKQMHDTVDSYNKKIRYAIDNWDRLQGNQPQKQGGGKDVEDNSLEEGRPIDSSASGEENSSEKDSLSDSSTSKEDKVKKEILRALIDLWKEEPWVFRETLAALAYKGDVEESISSKIEGIAKFFTTSTTKEDIPAGDWEAAQAWHDWHEWAEIVAASSADNPQ
jgi:hypothetical protein